VLRIDRPVRLPDFTDITGAAKVQIEPPHIPKGRKVPIIMLRLRKAATARNGPCEVAAEFDLFPGVAETGHQYDVVPARQPDCLFL
jgi:hypothetical protein